MASFGFTDPLLLAYEQAGKSLSEIRWLVLPMVDDQSESIIFNDQVYNRVGEVHESRIRELVRVSKNETDMASEAWKEADKHAKDLKAAEARIRNEHNYIFNKAKETVKNVVPRVIKKENTGSVKKMVMPKVTKKEEHSLTASCSQSRSGGHKTTIDNGEDELTSCKRKFAFGHDREILDRLSRKRKMTEPWMMDDEEVKPSIKDLTKEKDVASVPVGTLVGPSRPSNHSGRIERMSRGDSAKNGEEITSSRSNTAETKNSWDWTLSDQEPFPSPTSGMDSGYNHAKTKIPGGQTWKRVLHTSRGSQGSELTRQSSGYNHTKTKIPVGQTWNKVHTSRGSQESGLTKQSNVYDHSKTDLDSWSMSLGRHPRVHTSRGSHEMVNLQPSKPSSNIASLNSAQRAGLVFSQLPSAVASIKSKVIAKPVKVKLEDGDNSQLPSAVASMKSKVVAKPAKVKLEDGGDSRWPTASNGIGSQVATEPVKVEPEDGDEEFDSVYLEDDEFSIIHRYDH